MSIRDVSSPSGNFSLLQLIASLSTSVISHQLSDNNFGNDCSKKKKRASFTKNVRRPVLVETEEQYLFSSSHQVLRKEV